MFHPLSFCFVSTPVNYWLSMRAPITREIDQGVAKIYGKLALKCLRSNVCDQKSVVENLEREFGVSR
jgi:hypothetical protein